MYYLIYITCIYSLLVCTSYLSKPVPVYVEGTISGLPEEGLNGKKNGDKITTEKLVTANNIDPLQGKHGIQAGNVVKENSTGVKYYLRDDYVFRDAVEMPQAPGGVATLKDTHIVDGSNGTLHGTIYNDWSTKKKKKDGESVEIKTNWREPPIDIKTLMGGHLILSTDRNSYYVQRGKMLWPPHLSSKESMGIRRRLPSVGDGKTILDVIESEMKRFGDFSSETIGPCLSMPRILYGSHEDRSDPSWQPMAPEGFSDDDFVTLQYRWHAIKEARANKFQKTIVDVSRLPMGSFDGEAENIHVPVKYHCRSLALGGPPRYSTSYFRVVSDHMASVS